MAENKVRWTDEQQKVIDIRNSNILVSAAAGSGKTAVLVERIIRLITDKDDPQDIDRFLVVTFTRAAASQMKEKISRALNERLEKDPNDANLHKQAALIHNAHISTIDSFCQYVIKNSITEGESDPGFRITEEGENGLLEEDVLNELIEKLFLEGDEDFLDLAEHMITGSDDSDLSKAISSLYNKAVSGPWPKDWLEKRSKDYDCPDGRLPDDIAAFLTDMVRTSMAEIDDLYSDAFEAATEGGLAEANIEMIRTEYEAVREMSGILNDVQQLDENTYERLRGLAGNITFARFSNKHGESEDPESREQAKNLRAMGKDNLKKLRSSLLNTSYVNHVEHISACSGVIRTLCKVTSRYIDELAAVKRERKLMSFSDCEHQALEILVRKTGEDTYEYTDTAKEFSRYFSCVYIDEYQDSNLVQELILSAVSGEDRGVYNRFMVGDVKQSIYRFRQAEPRIFTDKYHEYGYDDPVRCKVDLNRNFRSRKEVIDSINALFERVMTEETGGSDYTESAALKAGAEYPEPDGDEYVTEILFADRDDPDTAEDSSEPETPDGDDEEANGNLLENAGKDRIEGEAIARRIEELMDSGFRVRDEENEGYSRPLKFSDIVILYRSGLGFATTYKAVLEEHGIPAHLTGSTGYFTTYEISCLMNLLRILVNPLQDIYFYGVMEGVFGSFTPEEISLVSVCYRNSLAAGIPLTDGYLYRACVYAASEETDTERKGDGDDPEGRAEVSKELKIRLRRFLEMIDRYRELSGYLPVETLLNRIITDTGYRNLVTAMHGGDRRAANVDMLLRKASDYASTSYFGLYNFIRYIDTLRKSEALDAEAEVTESEADVVRIMTTHKSKGLEFPVCFIARMGNKFNMQDAYGSFILDYEAGLGIRDRDVQRRLEFDTLYHKYVADVIERKTLAEEMRILYVAMTRAKEKLILTCAGISKRRKDDPGHLSISRPKGISRYIDWYLNCICDETGEDRIVPESERSVLTPLSLTYSRIPLDEASRKDAENARALEKGLMERFLYSGISEISEDDEYLMYLRSLLSAVYPHTDLRGLYTKTSVSEIKESAIIEYEEAMHEMYPRRAAVPMFVSGKKDTLKATVRGSAFHRFLELADFTELCNPDSVITNPGSVDHMLRSRIGSSLDRFVTERRMSAYERDIFADNREYDRLEKFFGSGTAMRMREAQIRGDLRREAPFMMGISADKVDAGYPREETVLIQGIIDVYWIEDGRAVILDYKTDRSKDPEYYTGHYKTQLDLYAEALEKMRIPVGQKLIYSFEIGDTIVL
ncbi:MAG: helicase-exonuclease AddAB subunit AddA [Lachnospiraceae bacterium]|nr:helicase-exonuclease AddAB subunit AddA [Lachnospiraceae bacterium]